MSTETPAQPTTIPPLTGFNSDYRLYTVAHVPFDRLPAYEDGGPSLVTVTEWGCSASITHGKPGCVANVHRFEGALAEGRIVKHELDGQWFPSTRDADRAKYDAGLLAYMVRERHAAKYGLPSGPDAA